MKQYWYSLAVYGADVDEPMNAPESERRVRSLRIRSDDARRAQAILLLANGDSTSMIEATVPCFRDYINRWRRRFLADCLDGPAAATKGNRRRC